MWTLELDSILFTYLGCMFVMFCLANGILLLCYCTTCWIYTEDVYDFAYTLGLGFQSDDVFFRKVLNRVILQLSQSFDIFVRRWNICAAADVRISQVWGVRHIFHFPLKDSWRNFKGKSKLPWGFSWNLNSMVLWHFALIEKIQKHPGETGFHVLINTQSFYPHPLSGLL